MSCSLIEAKFLVLDRTIKMLSNAKSLRTPKVASSEQLRELVETQKATSLLPTMNRVVVTRPNQPYSSTEKTTRSQPNTAREEKSEKKVKHSRSRPSTGRRDPHESSTEFVPDKWVDPKQKRAEELLQDTWHEIESAVNWGQSLGSPIQAALRSKLLNGSVRDDQERESSLNDLPSQEQYVNNQINAATDAFSAAVHNALPRPKRPLISSAGLQPKKSRAYLSTRCRSAPLNIPDRQPKNWFAPSDRETSQKASKAKRKTCRQRPTSTQNQVKERQRVDKPPPTSRPESHPRSRPEIKVVSETTKQCSHPVPNPDDPSFYMLELRLMHPEPLTNWRFQASFADISVNPAKTVILEDLTADDENFLMFDDPKAAHNSISSRYFNPFCYFPGLRRPSDLYGHVLRIIVTSLQPVTRIVINTSVQFTRFPDEIPVEPNRSHSDTVANQEASPVRVLNQRNRSAPSASRRHRNLSRPRPRQQRPVRSNNEDSTASLAKDQCSPWLASDQDDVNSNSDAACDILGPLLALRLDEPRSPSPTASPRPGPSADHLAQGPMTTIDKKKMQLQNLRANIRREMLEEEKLDQRQHV